MKQYNEEDIDALIEEVKATFTQPLIKAAQEELLAKAEAGKRVESAKEGGNGTEPAKGPAVESDKGARSDAMMKTDPALSKEGSDPSAAPKPEGSSSEAPADAASAPSDAPSEDAAPEPGGGDEHPEAQAGSEKTLEQAYGELSDEDLQAHYEALKAVVMSRMQSGAPGAAPADAGSPPPPAPAPAAGAPDMGAPPPAGPDMGKAAMPPPPPPAGMPAMKSETSKAEELNKAEINDLKKQVEGLTNLLETMLTKPVRKSVTTMAQYMAKSELEKPVTAQPTVQEIKTKLGKAAQTATLAKSDRDLINRYFLDGPKSVKFEEIEHLLK